MDRYRHNLRRYCVVAGVALALVSADAAMGQSCSQCKNAHCSGVTVDMDDNVWCSGYDAGTLTIFPSNGGPPTAFDTTIDNTCDQGVAVTPIDNHIWVVHSQTENSGCKDPDRRVSRFSYDSVHETLTLCETLDVGSDPDPPTGSRPTGIAVDANGYVYVTNHEESNVTRIIPAQIEPCTGSGDEQSQVDKAYVAIPGSKPEDYGTMTGFVALQTSGTGTWTAVHDSGVFGGRWSRVLWNQEAGVGDCPLMPVPTGTSLTVSVRAADTQVGLASQPYVEVLSGVPFTDIRGRYIQVMARLKGSCASQPFATPVLCDLSIRTDLFAGPDCNSNGLPDESERDCNINEIPDDCDVANETSGNCNITIPLVSELDIGGAVSSAIAVEVLSGLLEIDGSLASTHSLHITTPMYASA